MEPFCFVLRTVILASFSTRIPAEEEKLIDNHGASVRDKLVMEKKNWTTCTEMKVRFEDAFILQRVRA
jgi:hypothetical protein